MTEKVNHPIHYNHHPSGVEAIDIIEHMIFNLGNAFKYIFRFNLKGGLEDIDKAIWYLERQTKNPNTLHFEMPDAVYLKIQKFLEKAASAERPVRRGRVPEKRSRKPVKLLQRHVLHFRT